MDIKEKIIASKYARAYLNLYFDTLTQENLDALAAFDKFLVAHKGVLCFLSLPGLTEQVWQNFLNQLYARFLLPLQLTKLIKSLLDRGSIYLLPLVIDNLLKEFWLRKNVVHFIVTSSHALDEQGKSKIISFLAEKTGAFEIKATFLLDESLIYGITMKSSTHMFEHSVARELKKVKESLLERVQL